MRVTGTSFCGRRFAGSRSIADRQSGTLDLAALPASAGYLDPTVEQFSASRKAATAAPRRTKPANAIVVNVSAGQTYLIAVGGRGGRRGQYELFLAWLE